MAGGQFGRWDDFVEEAKEILGRHELVKDAAAEMSEFLGLHVSPSSLKEAFRNRKLGSPGKYLKQNCGWGGKERAALPEMPQPAVPASAPPPAVQPSEEVAPGNPQHVDVQDFRILYRDPLPLDGEQRWLVIGDTHVPWMDKGAMQACLQSEFAQNATRVCLAGDLLDNEQFSKHERETDVPLRMHYKQMCEEVIKPILSLPRVQEVRVLAGNHDNWTRRYKGRRIIPDAYFMLKDNAGHDLLEVLGRIKLDVPDDRLIYRFGMENWYTAIGDAIVAHPDRFLGPTQAGKPGRTVWERFEWFWKRNPELRCLIIGHTHRWYEERCAPACYGSREILLMEACCMQNAQGAEYSLSAKSKYDPFHVGWVELVQVDGKTDFDRSRAVLHQVVG